MSGTGRIADLVARLEHIADPAWRARLSLQMAGAVRGLIDDGFSRRTSPYSDAWRSRKGQYAWPLLERTGAMRNGWRLTQCDATGFRFVNIKPYAPYQNYGTSRGIDPREMIPSEAFGLGATWRAALNQTAANAVRDLMRGK